MVTKLRFVAIPVTGMLFGFMFPAGIISGLRLSEMSALLCMQILWKLFICVSEIK
jgi:fumarate reductase subunit D